MHRIVLWALPVILIGGAASAGISPGQQEIYRARDRVLPALVHIQPVVKDYNTGELKKQEVVGSGVIFHPDGYVVTNYHVAGKAVRIICTLADKEQVSAEYVGGDPPTDIAVIKLNLENYKKKLTTAEFGNSDSVEVGQFVLAMGSPFALSRTVSAGVVSTKDRYFTDEVRLPTGERTGSYNLWIQTDAAINPGNSGGPLVDLSGRVIGINSRANRMANNIAFSIPINVVREATAAILNDGKVTRSWIGTHAQALQELESYFGTSGEQGVLIASLDSDSPAEAAGLQAGDLILAIDDTPVSARFAEELPVFYRKIARTSPGTTLTLTVQRGADMMTIPVVTKALGELLGEDFECADWGITVKGITRQMRIENQLRDSAGVFVTGVKRTGNVVGGLRPGDVVVAVDRQPVSDLAEFVSLYQDMVAAEQDNTLLTVRRGGATRFVVITAAGKEKALLNE